MSAISARTNVMQKSTKMLEVTESDAEDGITESDGCTEWKDI